MAAAEVRLGQKNRNELFEWEWDGDESLDSNELSVISRSRELENSLVKQLYSPGLKAPSECPTTVEN